MEQTQKQPKRGWLRNLPWIGDRLADRIERAPNVAVLRLTGVIGAGRFGRASGGLSLTDLAGPIETAFRLPRLKAVALVVNSPGGSPVQSDLIAGRVRQLAEEKDIPVLAFCEDAAASGGYWLACAADTIYARPASVIGSIGVISAGFGFDQAIEKLGVERRVYTAGESKSQLDPFKPEDATDIKRLKSLQDDIHAQFKDWVKERRGERLTGAARTVFSGQFWTAGKARDLGLIDEIGDVRSVTKALYGDKVRLRLIEKPKGLFRRRLGLSGLEPAGLGLGDGIAEGLLSAAETRFWWARLGL